MARNSQARAPQNRHDSSLFPAEGIHFPFILAWNAALGTGEEKLFDIVSPPPFFSPLYCVSFWNSFS